MVSLVKPPAVTEDEDGSESAESVDSILTWTPLTLLGVLGRLRSVPMNSSLTTAAISSPLLTLAEEPRTTLRSRGLFWELVGVSQEFELSEFTELSLIHI